MVFLYRNKKKKIKNLTTQGGCKTKLMDELRNRLKKFHEREGVSYKVISREIGVSVGVMYNFTSEIRDLKEFAAENLDEYLKVRGY